VTLASLLLVIGCTPKVEYVDTFCTSYVPVHYSASGDTAETKRQTQENNAVWTKLCK